MPNDKTYTFDLLEMLETGDKSKWGEIARRTGVPYEVDEKHIRDDVLDSILKKHGTSLRQVQDTLQSDEKEMTGKKDYTPLSQEHLFACMSQKQERVNDLTQTCLLFYGTAGYYDSKEKTGRTGNLKETWETQADEKRKYLDKELTELDTYMHLYEILQHPNVPVYTEEQIAQKKPKGSFHTLTDKDIQVLVDLDYAYNTEKKPSVVVDSFQKEVQKSADMNRVKTTIQELRQDKGKDETRYSREFKEALPQVERMMNFYLKKIEDYDNNMGVGQQEMRKIAQKKGTEIPNTAPKHLSLPFEDQVFIDGVSLSKSAALHGMNKDWKDRSAFLTKCLMDGDKRVEIAEPNSLYEGKATVRGVRRIESQLFSVHGIDRSQYSFLRLLLHDLGIYKIKDCVEKNRELWENDPQVDERMEKITVSLKESQERVKQAVQLENDRQEPKLTQEEPRQKVQVQELQDPQPQLPKNEPKQEVKQQKPLEKQVKKDGPSL